MADVAVYPGTFDPVTYGHIDIVQRGLHIFDELILAVAHGRDKSPLFTVEERTSMLREATKGMKVTVEDFDGLLVDYVRRKKAHIILRGLRVVSDFEYEFQMALANRRLNEEVETVFLMPSEQYTFLSSRLIKEIVALGAPVEVFVPPHVQIALEKKLGPNE